MSTPRHKSRRYSSDPLKRSVVACNRCRGRKTKCLGNAPYPCMSCEDVGAECIYPNVEERIYVPKSYLANLQARADAADSERTASTSEASPAPDEKPDGEEDDWWYEGMENLFVSRSGEHHYVGKSSSTYLATTLNPASNVAWDVSPMYNDNLWLRRAPNISQPQLPPFDFAKRLYEQQYIYIGSIFAFVQPKHFEERLRQVYDLPVDSTSREDCLVHCQILLILAFGQMYSLNQWSGSEGPPGFVYFKHALRFLPDIHEEGSILFVEVLGLVAYYLQILNRRDAAFLYIGLALRMAISLGLHQEVSNSDMNLIEREHRRRVWWSTYSMDRILCVKSGNPISIHDEDIAVAFPSFHPPFDASPSPPVVLAHYSQLSRILGKIGEQIYRRRHQSGKGLVASVQAIMMELAAWLKDIPPELTLDFTTFHLRLSREAVSTFLHYYQCVNMTGRPLLLHICQKRINAMAEGTASPDWTQGLSSGIVNVVKNSIAAARAATTVVDAAEKHNVLATYGFMDGEHAFSAALVLVMVNVALPYNERDQAATEQSLKNLKGMADKGNEYIKAKHVLLLNLRAALRRRTQSSANPDSTALTAPAGQDAVFTGAEFAPGHPGNATYGVQNQTHNETNLSLGPIQENIPVDDEALRTPLQGYQDVFVDLNMEDDQGIWDELNGNVELDMDADWIRDALRQEQT